MGYTQLYNMATLAAVRFGTGTLLSRSLIIKGAPVTGAIVPKKAFGLSAACSGRIYGPDPSSANNPAATTHWKQERVVSAVLLPIVPAAIIFPNPVLDTLLSATVILHNHWGLGAVITDYIHVDGVKKMLNGTLLVASILAFGGLCYLNYNDMGFGNAVRAIYSQLNQCCIDLLHSLIK